MGFGGCGLHFGRQNAGGLGLHSGVHGREIQISGPGLHGSTGLHGVRAGSHCICWLQEQVMQLDLLQLHMGKPPLVSSAAAWSLAASAVLRTARPLMPWMTVAGGLRRSLIVCSSNHHSWSAASAGSIVIPAVCSFRFRSVRNDQNRSASAAVMRRCVAAVCMLMITCITHRYSPLLSPARPSDAECRAFGGGISPPLYRVDLYYE